jgi:hypothetical protein
MLEVSYRIASWGRRWRHLGALVVVLSLVFLQVGRKTFVLLKLVHVKLCVASGTARKNLQTRYADEELNRCRM